MGHLCLPIDQTPISTALRDIETAHRYLVQQAQDALEKFKSETQLIDSWGSSLKRVQIQIGGHRPNLIGSKGDFHNLFEVTNQCASIERLIDALRWALVNIPEFGTVRICHSTTSSNSSDLADHDLVLESPTHSLACFEVSDVVSMKDGNGKCRKDIFRLISHVMPGSSSSERRRFLVVSTECAVVVRRRKPVCANGLTWSLAEFKAGNNTVLFELVVS